MPPRGTAECYTNVIAMLKTIRGAPTFWTNLEGRVYSALWTPADNKSKLPFISTCLIDEPHEYTWADDGDHLVFGWKVRLAAFVPETASNTADRLCSFDLLKLHDDIVKVILLDPTLQDTASVVRLSAGAPLVSGIPEFLYGEQHFNLEITQYLSLEGLGP